MQSFCAVYVPTSFQTGTGTARKIHGMGKKGSQPWRVSAGEDNEGMPGWKGNQTSFFCRVRDKAALSFYLQIL